MYPTSVIYKIKDRSFNSVVNVYGFVGEKSHTMGMLQSYKVWGEIQLDMGIFGKGILLVVIFLIPIKIPLGYVLSTIPWNALEVIGFRTVICFWEILK